MVPFSASFLARSGSLRSLGTPSARSGRRTFGSKAKSRETVPHLKMLSEPSEKITGAGLGKPGVVLVTLWSPKFRKRRRCGKAATRGWFGGGGSFWVVLGFFGYFFGFSWGVTFSRR